MILDADGPVVMSAVASHSGRQTPRNSNYRGRLYIDLLIKEACFVTKANNIFNIKSS